MRQITSLLLRFPCFLMTQVPTTKSLFFFFCYLTAIGPAGCSFFPGLAAVDWMRSAPAARVAFFLFSGLCLSQLAGLMAVFLPFCKGLVCCRCDFLGRAGTREHFFCSCPINKHSVILFFRRLNAQVDRLHLPITLVFCLPAVLFMVCPG